MADPQTTADSTPPGGAPAPRPSRAQAFRETLSELTRLDGVRGGLIVTPDGLVITSELPPRVPVEALAALAATLGRELELGASRLERGAFRTALFSADDGTVFVGGSPVGYVTRDGHTGAWYPSGTVGRAQRGGVSERRSTGARWCSRPTGVSLAIDQRSSSAGVNSFGTSFSSASGTWPRPTSQRPV